MTTPLSDDLLRDPADDVLELLDTCRRADLEREGIAMYVAVADLRAGRPPSPEPDSSGSSFRIFLHLCRPLIAVLVLLAFMAQWNDFLWPLITLKDPALYTLPVSLRFLQGQYDADYGGLMAALLTCLPLVVLFLLLQRYFVQRLARTGIK